MTHPQDIARQAQAQAYWRLGQQAEQAGRLDEAYQHLRRAHDLVVDCPRLHQQAHQHLYRLNRKRRAWRELLTDAVLLALGPVGSFELVAFALTKQVLGGVVCSRSLPPSADQAP